MVRVESRLGILFRFGEISLQIKQRERKKFSSNKKHWTKSEMVFVQNGMTKNLGQNFLFFPFQLWNSWTKTATKSCIANQWKKCPNDRLLVQNLHTTKREKNKKNVLLVCKVRPKGIVFFGPRTNWSEFFVSVFVLAGKVGPIGPMQD